MVEGSRSDSETDENLEKSSSDELENCKEESDDDDGEQKGREGGGVSEYEKQRMTRIRENRKRLESLGLPSLASTLSSGSKLEKKQAKRKGKLRKTDEDDDDDEEYRPPSDGEEVRVSSSSSSSSSEDEDEEEDDDFQVSKARSSGSRRVSVRKGKNIHSLNTRKDKKKLPVEKKTSESDYIDDDEALMQAIALSLGNSSEVSGAAFQGPPRNSRTNVADVGFTKRKGEGRIKENDGKRKRIKSNTSRVQMSEDQVIIHFFHFDEAGNGNITKNDLQRVATAHDFDWTDKEMADMIHSFDSDGDGKLSLDDFWKIVSRCNMVQGRESSLMV